MQGYGRGARMKIERDRIEWLSGLRAGETLGSPVAMLIPNRDWANWEDVMAYEGSDPPGELRRRRVTRPRPGHADLAGVLKYDRLDGRDILERASARETTARVAAGALAKRLLDEFGVEIGSHVVSLGGVARSKPHAVRRCPVPLNEASDRSEVRVLDPALEAEIIRRIDAAKKAGDTLGGEVEVVARGVVVGLGSHVSWDRKLDGRLAGMLMSIPAVKGVEIGMGFEAARRPGSEVHDPIEARGNGAAGRSGAGRDPRGGFRRPTNNAGGLEGGITTGEPVVVKVAMKPIATLMSPLPTVDLDLGAAGQGGERAVRCHGGAGDGGDRRSAGGAGAGRRHAGEVRRATPCPRCGATTAATWRRWAPAGLRWRIRREQLMPRHIVLVGLPGSGKSTVGGWWPRHCPLLSSISTGCWCGRWACRSSQIFGMVGEARFREMERDAVKAAQGGNPGVIVPGRGWAAQPGQLEAAMGPSLVVYLKCLPGDRSQTQPAGGGPAVAGGGRPGPADAGAARGTGAVLPPGAPPGRRRAQYAGGGCRRDHGPGPAARRMVALGRRPCLGLHSAGCGFLATSRL